MYFFNSNSTSSKSIHFRAAILFLLMAHAYPVLRAEDITQFPKDSDHRPRWRSTRAIFNFIKQKAKLRRVREGVHARGMFAVDVLGQVRRAAPRLGTLECRSRGRQRYPLGESPGFRYGPRSRDATIGRGSTDVPERTACARRPRWAPGTGRARRCGRCRRGRGAGTASPAVPRPGPAARAGSAPAAAWRPRAPPATRLYAHRRRSPALCTRDVYTTLRDPRAR